jgi:hypothetical protein
MSDLLIPFPSFPEFKVNAAPGVFQLVVDNAFQSIGEIEAAQGLLDLCDAVDEAFPEDPDDDGVIPNFNLSDWEPEDLDS